MPAVLGERVSVQAHAARELESYSPKRLGWRRCVLQFDRVGGGAADRAGDADGCRGGRGVDPIESCTCHELAAVGG